MKSAIIVILAAAGIGGIAALPASAQQSTQPATKLQSFGAMSATSAARELPKDTNTQTQLKGEAGESGLASSMAGDAGLVDTKAGTSSVARGRTQ
jgi:hypothetical protein